MKLTSERSRRPVDWWHTFLVAWSLRDEAVMDMAMQGMARSVPHFRKMQPKGEPHV